MKKVLPVVIVILLIIGISASLAYKMIADKYKPTEEFMDYEAELGLAEDEYAITLNRELLEERALKIDGETYISMSLATTSINARCYWDEGGSRMIYTTPSEIHYYSPDKEKYTVKSWEDSKKVKSPYMVVRTVGDTYYIATRFLQENTQMNYAEYTDPRRVVMTTSWGEVETVSVSATTPIRYMGGIKSEVLRNAEPGEHMALLETYDDWTNVATDDGYIGWIATEYVTSPEMITTEAPAFDAPVYSSIHKDYKINMAWHQVMTEDSNVDISSVLESTPGINTISPTWFYFKNSKGDVGCIATQDYVDTCHYNGIEVWALFSNEFGDALDRVFSTDKTDEVLSSTKKRTSVIEQVVEYVKDYDIDGINIDFELISMDGADDYVQFIRELSIACRANDIILSIDNYVPEYTYYYNRREQGIVADYVVIMGYDETTGGSDTPGPVASQSFVRKGITDTLELVDASKVINGIPFYSRVWASSPDGYVDSFACGMDEALSYLTSHDVKPEYREDVGLNYGSYTSDIDGNHYEIWLQDADSVKNEMKMIVDYDLAGVASWKIGFESGTEIWDIISKNLNK